MATSSGALDFATCALPARRVCDDLVATLECREALVVVVGDGAGGVTGGAEAARLVGNRVADAVADGLDRRYLRVPETSLAIPLHVVG
jgi:hypothetical protein